MFHVPTAAKAVGSPKSSCAACSRESSMHFTLPQAQQCYKLPVSERGRWYLGMDSQSNDSEEIMVQPLRLPLYRATASGIHPYCPSSVSCTGDLFLALVPKPCKIAGRMNSFSISIAWHIFSPGSTRTVTSPGRRLRVGSSLFVCRSCPLMKVGLSPSDSLYASS